MSWKTPPGQAASPSCARFSPAAQRGLIGGGIVGRDVQGLDGLLGESGFPRLPWPGKHLEKPPGLPQAPDEPPEQGATKRVCFCGHNDLLNIVSNFTQEREQVKA